jgi:putative ATP-dependent endonuclease of OLD family
MLQTPRSLASLPLFDEEDSLSAQNLALLILVGSLLQAVGDETLSPHATPLVVIEEPEAHLHPILAASLWGTLQRLPAQQVITTNSGDLLASAPLQSLRRLTRPGDETLVHQLPPRGLSLKDQRRVGYHVRIQRGASLFARCWLLVEGETEAWLLPELARECGYVLASEGVYCIEFAQCGVMPLVRLANAIGIEWHLLADGDDAGQSYVRAAKRELNKRSVRDRVTAIAERDVEHCLWENGYARVFQEAAFPGQKPGQPRKRKMGKRARRRARRRGQHGPKFVIDKAIHNQSKPFMALKALEAVAEPGSAGVPADLRRAIEAAVYLARTSAGVPTRRPKTLRLSRIIPTDPPIVD